MRRLVCALLSGLVLVPAPVHAQGSVTLTLCNTGTVDIEVFVSGTGTPIRPATCATVAQAKGAAQPAYVGIAFTDSRGQWGAARRFDGVPYMGSSSVLSRATRNEMVRRGNASVSLPLQLLFRPRVPQCVSTGTTVPDQGRIYVGATYCEELVYTLTVEAYPDTREIRLSGLPVGGAMSANPPYRFSEKPAVNWAEEEAARKAREAPEPVNWSDLLSTLSRIAGSERLSSGAPLRLPGDVVIRGTVSAVEIRQQPLTLSFRSWRPPAPQPFDANATIPMAEINFRESPLAAGRPYPEFNVCTERLDILTEQFGADYRTSMIGKVIEVRGIANLPGTECWGQLGEIQLFLARQVRQVPSVQFAAGTRVWVPPPVYIPPVRPAGFTLAEKAALDPKVEELQRRRSTCAEQAAAAHPNFHLSSERFSAYAKARDDCIESGIAPTAPPATSTPAVVLPTPGSRLAVTPTARAGALPIASITAQWLGRSVVATGIVARVEAIRGVNHVYFEGAGEKYVLCIREGMNGMQHPSELVGKTLELTVRIDLACLDRRVTIGATELGQPTQLRIVGDSPAQAPASGPVAAPASPRAGAPVAAPPPAPARATAPAPTTTNGADAAAARAKAVQEEQQRAAQERLAAQQKSAQEAKQRAQACMQELFKAYPDGGRSDPAGFQKGLLACAQIQQAPPVK